MNYMFYRIVRLLLVISIVLASGICSTGTTSRAYQQMVTADPVRGYAGMEITLSGEGFTPAVIAGINSANTRISYVSIYFANKANLVRSVAVDEWGHFSTCFRIPETPSGTYYIWVHDESTDSSCWVTTTIDIETNITLSKYSGYEGDNITVSGTGFLPLSPINAYFNGKKNASGLSDFNGSFTIDTFIIPECKWPVNGITAVDIQGREDDVDFITRHQRLLVGVSTVTPGLSISIWGNGFSPQEDISINLYSDDVIFCKLATTPAKITSDDIGGFAGTIQIPDCQPDDYILEATDGVCATSSTLKVIQGGTLSRILGFAGSEVSCTGSGFLPKTVVVISFDNVPFDETETDENGEIEHTLVIPPCSPGSHIISFSDGIFTKAYSFSVIPKARISTNRLEGHVGAEYTVTGMGFLPGKLAVVNFDDTKVAESAIDASESFVASFPLPSSPAGEHTVTVTDGTNMLSAVVSIESVPPETPALGTRSVLETIEKEILLKWEDVIDPSGVRYSLQIASDNTFVPDSIIMKQNNLVVPEFIVSTEALGIDIENDVSVCYWRVRAEDGALNTGGWSETGQFVFDFHKSSSVFSLGLVGEVAALGGLFVFWLFKKKRA